MKKMHIAVIGGAAVGKSVYTASLIDTMRKELWNKQKMILEYHNVDTSLYDNEYGIPMQKNNMPGKTCPPYIRIDFPIYMMNNRGVEMLDFALYDFAEETLSDPTFFNIEDIIKVMKDIDAILYMIDPLSFEGIKVNGANKCLHYDKSNAPQLLETFISVLSKVQSTKDIKKIPVAVVLTKKDMLKNEYILELEDVSTFFKTNNMDLENILNKHFKNHRCFSVSCLKNNGHRIEWVADDTLEPFVYLISKRLPSAKPSCI